MQKIIKKVLLILLVLLLLAQFYPRAKKNDNLSTANDIIHTYTVPENVHEILKISCYGCHSNKTNYPWYSYIQPVSWWLNDHITEAKKELNFSEFASYSIARQYRKLEEISKEVKVDEMLLKSYTIIHQSTKLNKDKKLAIAN